jgi:hypothetical protein
MYLFVNIFIFKKEGAININIVPGAEAMAKLVNKIPDIFSLYEL